MWRWLKADTRQITLERLDETINAATVCPTARPLLDDARAGMQHLLDTYHTDPTTVARLEAILMRMHPDAELTL